MSRLILTGLLIGLLAGAVARPYVAPIIAAARQHAAPQHPSEETGARRIPGKESRSMT